MQPRLAPVRPRVQVHAGGIARVLEEEIGELLANGARATVRLCGPAGSGKRAALAHLAAVFAGDQRLSISEAPPAAGEFVVDVALAAPGERRGGERSEQRWTMAPWSDDECLEYVRMRHRERAGDVWRAWCAVDAEHDLRRWPALCADVLDVLARDAAPADAWQALRLLLAETLADRTVPMRVAALQAHVRSSNSGEKHEPGLERTFPAFRSATVRAFLGAERLFELATSRGGFPLHALVWSRNLAIALMVVAQQELQRLEELRATVRSDGDIDKRLALSLLAVTQEGYRPEPDRLQRLAHANLAFVDLSGKTVSGNCRRVHLVRARLQRTTFDGCDLGDAVMNGAKLDGASLRGAHCEGLSAVRASAESLAAEGAVLRRSDWSGACLRMAKLDRAHLDGADLRDADLSAASLVDANMAGVDLRATQLQGADLRAANLECVAASDVTWDGLLAGGSRWAYADLTGSRLRGAHLEGALFGGARMAHVDWEGADLRMADLRGATFHMGNARSGLVGSEIASEGSRTGFYTDESFEDHFREPELVRKANLQNCDLRGARLDDVDLYLVDLRGAQLDAEQLVWARRCRALLDNRGST